MGFVARGVAASASFAFDGVLVGISASVAAVRSAGGRAHEGAAANVMRATGQFLRVGDVTDHTATIPA